MAELHINEDEAVHHVAEKLTDRYGEEVEEVVEEKHEQYADAPVRDFVPIFVERDTREEFGDPGPAGISV